MDRMKREWRLASLAGLTITATPAAFIGFVGLWLLAAHLAAKTREVRIGQALLVGFLISAIHFISELAHQLGHAAVAVRTGYPMTGIRFGTFFLFATSCYPDDEPELPAAIHIRRALGGPILSIVIGLCAGVALMLNRGRGGLGRLLIQFVFFANMLLMGLGAFLPLGFTDGSTILRHWRRS